MDCIQRRMSSSWSRSSLYKVRPSAYVIWRHVNWMIYWQNNKVLSFTSFVIIANLSVILLLLFRSTLMRQSGSFSSKIPWRDGNIMWNMGIDIMSKFILLSWNSTSLTSFFQLFRFPIVISACLLQLRDVILSSNNLRYRWSRRCHLEVTRGKEITEIAGRKIIQIWCELRNKLKSSMAPSLIKIQKSERHCNLRRKFEPFSINQMTDWFPMFRSICYHCVPLCPITREGIFLPPSKFGMVSLRTYRIWCFCFFPEICTASVDKISSETFIRCAG